MKSVDNPRWADDSLRRVTMDVTNDDNTVTVVTFNVDDVDPEKARIASLALDGGFGPIAVPPVLPPAVPRSVTPAQARIALRRAGIRGNVETAIKNADPEVQDWFEYALVWERDNPNIAVLGSALGLTSAQIDNLFIAASKIKG